MLRAGEGTGSRTASMPLPCLARVIKTAAACPFSLVLLFAIRSPGPSLSLHCFPQISHFSCSLSCCSPISPLADAARLYSLLVPPVAASPAFARMLHAELTPHIKPHHHPLHPLPLHQTNFLWGDEQGGRCRKKCSTSLLCGVGGGRICC